MRRALPAERPVLARARCWGRLVVGSDSFNDVFRPANSPVANRAAPGAAVAPGEGAPSAGASYTARGLSAAASAGPLSLEPPRGVQSAVREGTVRGPSAARP